MKKLFPFLVLVALIFAGSAFAQTITLLTSTTNLNEDTGAGTATLTATASSAGIHKLTWDGTDNLGNKVSSGAYLYRIIAGKNVITKKMLLMK